MTTDDFADDSSHALRRILECEIEIVRRTGRNDLAELTIPELEKKIADMSISRIRVTDHERVLVESERMGFEFGRASTAVAIKNQLSSLFQHAESGELKVGELRSGLLQQVTEGRFQVNPFEITGSMLPDPCRMAFASGVGRARLGVVRDIDSDFLKLQEMADGRKGSSPAPRRARKTLSRLAARLDAEIVAGQDLYYGEDFQRLLTSVMPVSDAFTERALLKTALEVRIERFETADSERRLLQESFESPTMEARRLLDSSANAVRRAMSNRYLPFKALDHVADLGVAELTRMQSNAALPNEDELDISPQDLDMVVRSLGSYHAAVGLHHRLAGSVDKAREKLDGVSRFRDGWSRMVGARDLLRKALDSIDPYADPQIPEDLSMITGDQFERAFANTQSSRGTQQSKFLRQEIERVGQALTISSWKTKASIATEMCERLDLEPLLGEPAWDPPPVDESLRPYVRTPEDAARLAIDAVARQRAELISLALPIRCQILRHPADFANDYETEASVKATKEHESIIRDAAGRDSVSRRQILRDWVQWFDSPDAEIHFQPPSTGQGLTF